MQGEPVPSRGLFPRAFGRCRGCARTFPATSSKATALRKRPAAANRSQKTHGTGPGVPIEPFEQDAPHSPVLPDEVLMHLHTVASKQMEPILMACFALIRVY